MKLEKQGIEIKEKLIGRTPGSRESESPHIVKLRRQKTINLYSNKRNGMFDFTKILEKSH
jgi:hypothetical protein